MIVRQPLSVAVGLIQAESVMADPRLSEAALGTRTRLVPLKVSALPEWPVVVHAGPTSVPVLPLPLRSAVVMPAPSLNAQAPTSPDGVGGALPVVASAMFEYPLR